MQNGRKLTNFWKGADCEFGVSLPLMGRTGFTAESEQVSESEAP
jgi:hypothetical protein